MVNDFYKQLVNKSASEKELVMVGRLSTVLLMVLSALFALTLQNALQLFDLILMFGAGTGLIFILRWFWWRINAWSEIAAMFVSGIVSIILNFTDFGTGLFGEGAMFPGWFKFPFIVLVTTIVWLVVTFVTRPESEQVLMNFYKKIQPGGPGWRRVLSMAERQQQNIIDPDQEKWSVPSGIMAMLVGCILIYSVMFATGNWIYGNTSRALILTGVAVLAALTLRRLWNRIKANIL